MNNDENDLYKVAKLGIEVEHWFKTPVGTYVLSRATAEVEDAFNQWMNEPDAPDLHKRANAARAAIIWLNDAIHDGEAAAAALEEEQMHE